MTPLEIGDPHFNAEWLRCRGWINEALAEARGRWDEAAVLRILLKGEAQFWPGEAAAIVTQVCFYDSFTSLFWWLGGGSLDALIAMHDPIIAWAKAAHGVTRAEISGRRGWLRALGYEPLWTAGEKEV